MDTKRDFFNDFVKFCDSKTPIEIGTICHTDMSDGEVLEIKGNKVFLYHMHKGYEQWWNIKELRSSGTYLSKYGLEECLNRYLESNEKSNSNKNTFR